MEFSIVLIIFLIGLVAYYQSKSVNNKIALTWALSALRISARDNNYFTKLLLKMYISDCHNLSINEMNRKWEAICKILNVKFEMKQVGNEKWVSDAVVKRIENAIYDDKFLTWYDNSTEENFKLKEDWSLDELKKLAKDNGSGCDCSQ